MNRAINIFSGIVLIIFFASISAVIYDFSMSNFTFKGLPFKFEIFAGIAVLMMVLGLIRIKRRWQGMKDMSRYSNFVYSNKLTKEAFKFAIVFSIAEIIVFVLALYYCYSLYLLDSVLILPMIAVLSLLLLESIIFLIRLKLGGNSFRYGMNDQVLAFFQREMHLLYFTGLLRVELYQKDIINFMYREELNLVFPTNIVEKEDRIAFREHLIEILEKKNVYIDDAFRKWE